MLFIPISVEVNMESIDYITIGRDKGYISISSDGEHITYHAQNKTYVYSDPEEKVRAEFYVELIEKYQYKSDLLGLEIDVPRRTPSDFADIVIFEDKEHKCPFIVVECKKENISKQEEIQAIEQSFGNANSLKSKYTSMVAGSVKFFFDVENYPARERKKNIIADLPINFGKPQQWRYKKGGPSWELQKANTSQLISIFSNCHDIIWEGGKKNPAEAFDEMSKLMFCKIRDERDTRNNGFYQYQIRTHEEPKSVAKRIRGIYSKAKNKDPEVFKTKIDIDDIGIYNVVLTLQSISLSRSDLDAKGRAFEAFMGKIFRGELGQFFTPREIVRFMVHMIEPSSEDVVIDPSCGSGGFLLNTLDYVRQELYENLDPEEAYREEVDYVRYNLYGIEINSQIARVAMMDMILHDDGHTNIEFGDGLDFFENYDSKRDIKANKYSIVLQNPPFGFNIKKEDKKYFSLYDLGKGKKQLSSQILFIERAYQLLKEGGKMGIVLPDSVTTNSTTHYVRDFIRKHFKILAIVSLPKETFMPSGTGVKTSLLFLKKLTKKEIEDQNTKFLKIRDKLLKQKNKELKILLSTINSSTKTGKAKISKLKQHFIQSIRESAEELYYERNSYPIFMAVAKHVGYDATGKPDKNDLYATDQEGNVLNSVGILGEYKRFKNQTNTYKVSEVLELVGNDNE